MLYGSVLAVAASPTVPLWTNSGVAPLAVRALGGGLSPPQSRPSAHVRAGDLLKGRTKFLGLHPWQVAHWVVGCRPHRAGHPRASAPVIFSKNEQSSWGCTPGKSRSGWWAAAPTEQAVHARPRRRFHPAKGSKDELSSWGCTPGKSRTGWWAVAPTEQAVHARGKGKSSMMLVEGEIWTFMRNWKY